MPATAPSAASSPPGGSQATPRVLIADDDTLSRNTVAALLASTGYQLRFAINGEETLEAVSQEVPDLVLLDVMMPGLDGFEVCQRLREQLRGDHVPIVLVTALDGRQEVLRGLEAGADDFLRKPVHGAELRARVSNLLKVRAYHQLLASQRDNALATVDSLRQQVLHADRLATLGTFAAGVSHELNNIAQVLHGLLEPSPTAGSADPGALEEADREMLSHVARHITELAQTILRLARPTSEPGVQTDLVKTVDEVRNMLRMTGRTRHAQVSLVLPREPCVIQANPVHAQQVFLNLMSNAADAVAGLREPAIEVGVRHTPHGRIEAWVQDNGPGMSKEVLARIFEPFYTTKPPGSGTGMGLPVVKQLVESWQGQLHVRSWPGHGTRMVVEVPEASMLPPTRPAP